MPAKKQSSEAAVREIRRRQGNWEDALANQKKAFKLNPCDAQIATEISATYLMVRRYREAVGYLDQSIALLPDQTPAYWLKEWTH